MRGPKRRPAIREVESSYLACRADICRHRRLRSGRRRVDLNSARRDGVRISLLNRQIAAVCREDKPLVVRRVLRVVVIAVIVCMRRMGIEAAAFLSRLVHQVRADMLHERQRSAKEQSRDHQGRGVAMCTRQTHDELLDDMELLQPTRPTLVSFGRGSLIESEADATLPIFYRYSFCAWMVSMAWLAWS